MTTLQERVAVVESEIKHLAEDFANHAKESRVAEANLAQKIDELFLLKAKGMGAFWLASSLLGTSIVGVIFMLVNWFRG